MCLTLPGKIISIDKNQAQVDLGEQKICAKIVETHCNASLQKNDWVLVYGDLILEKISSKEAAKIQTLLSNSYAKKP